MSRTFLHKVLDTPQEPEIAVSMGISGAVVNMYEDGSVLIKTQDTAVRIYELMDEEMRKILPATLVKIGMRIKRTHIRGGRTAKRCEIHIS